MTPIITTTVKAPSVLPGSLQTPRGENPTSLAPTRPLGHPDRDVYSTPWPRGIDSTPDFGEKDLKVVPDGAQAPSYGEWIYHSEIQTTLDLLNRVESGDTSLRIEGTTQSFLGGLFGRRFPHFKEGILRDLRLLCRTPLGRRLLNEITTHPFSVVIRPTTSKDGGWVKPRSESRARRSVKGQRGTGTGSTIYLPSDLTDDTFVVYQRAGYDGFPYESGAGFIVYPNKKDEIKQPRTIILAHELTHSHRAQRGALAPSGSFRPDSYHTQEEFETISGGYEFTENRFRRTCGLPARYGHFHHRVST